ncbi:hypothetical protein ACJQWK_04848 [Exserohilum turcicum]
MTKDDKAGVAAAQLMIDDEPDDWWEQLRAQREQADNGRDKRIYSTGCADENAKLTDCYYDKKDWRACKQEMEIFRQCWERHGNDKRTSSKNA